MNSRNKINPHLLPETLLAGDAAWLIVCAQHQETVILDNNETFKTVSLDKNPSQVEKQPMSPDDPDTIIDTVLKTDITTLIRKTFPHYSGHIQNKTSAPHRLVIKVMIIMLKLNYKDLTWSTVKGFIEDYISGNYDRQILANLEEITDDYITVSNVRLDKTNATKKVGEYKSLFNIKSV